MDTATIIAVLGFVITIAVNVAAIARWSGKTSEQIAAIKNDIRRLEEKQDKSNALKERMVAVEQSSKSAHHRLDGLEERINK
jgi:hypothetical protein